MKEYSLNKILHTERSKKVNFKSFRLFQLLLCALCILVQYSPVFSQIHATSNKEQSKKIVGLSLLNNQGIYDRKFFCFIVFTFVVGILCDNLLIFNRIKRFN